MAIIRIKQGGCGINYTDAKGNARYALKTAENGPFECDNAQADRLVRMGVAVYVGGSVYVGSVSCNDVESENSQESEKADELEKLTNEQLKNLAADRGIDLTGCKKKADYIAAIIDAEAEASDKVEVDELPDLSAADPE